MRAIADMPHEFGRGELDLTTRQQIQLRWFRIEHVPAIFARLQAVGLERRQTGMDNIRNVMGCPLAGLTTHELLDASPVVREYTDRFVGNKAFSNLPRKFNVAITRLPGQLRAAGDAGHRPGPGGPRRWTGMPWPASTSSVGGKQGSGGFTPARALDVFVAPGQAAEVCAEITLIFRDHGPREISRPRPAGVPARGLGRRSASATSWRRGSGRPLDRAGRDARNAASRPTTSV